MSDNEESQSPPPPTPPSPSAGSLSNPQVLVAVIGGLVTIAVAFIGILPTIIGNDDPTPTPPPPTVIVVTATQTIVPATATDVSLASTATAQPTDVLEETQPTETVPAQQAVVQPTAVPNLTLLYDDVSFTVHNINNGVMSLEGVTFRSASGEWDAARWGPSVYNSLPDDNCLRLRDMNSGQRQPPSVCGNLYGLILVGQSALFWRNTESFTVSLNGQPIAECAVAAETCAIHIP